MVDNSETRKTNFYIKPHSIKTFSDFTDYNNITNEGHFIMQYLKDYTDEFGDKTNFPDGTTHLKVGLSYEEMKSKLSGEEKKRLSKFFDTLDISNNEDGCFKVEEYIYDKKTGFDALVISDCDGNYRLCFGSTDQFSDKIHDFLIVGSTYSFSSLDYGIAKSLYNLITDKNVLTPQEAQARTVAKYCFKNAESNGKKLSLCGYSLGGALCENAVDTLMDNKNYDDVVDGIVLVNPLHADLSKEKILKMKNTENYNLYVNEKDSVHKLTKTFDYKDVEKVYSQKSDIEESGHNLGFFSDDNYIKYAFNSDGSIKEK